MSENSNENNQDIVLAQWQTCVEMANAISERRDNMNNLFVTLNLGLITAISFIWDIKTIALSCAGVIICIVWILFINNFKSLNKEKFNIINDMENRLPEKPFTNEWEKLKLNKHYLEGTKLEKILPVSLGIGYIIIMAIINFGK